MQEHGTHLIGCIIFFHLNHVSASLMLGNIILNLRWSHQMIWVDVMTIRALRYENHKALQFFLCFYSRSLCFTFLVVNFMINTLFQISWLILFFSLFVICSKLFRAFHTNSIERVLLFMPIGYKTSWDQPRSVISTPNTRHLSTRLRFLQHIPNRANGTIILSLHSYSSMAKETNNFGKNWKESKTAFDSFYS